MGSVQVAGGIPRVFRAAVTTTVLRHQLPFTSKYLIVRTDVAVRMYFTAEDATADENYVAIPAPAADAPYGEWQGPVEASHLWFLSGTTSNIEAVYFQKRG
jgi:hypothetical protein